VLQGIIAPPKERQRLASALGVNVITLMRWAKQDSQPQRSHLVQLVKVVQPHQRADLLNALLVAYPEMQNKFKEQSAEGIPASFFRQILRDQATIIETLRSWQLSLNILNEALDVLDPNRLGMAITPAICMPPGPDGKIRSLREHGGRGTLPWSADLEHQAIFLGMNCLAGHVMQIGRAASVQDVQKEKYIPVFAHPADLEHSAGAAPIWLEGKIAGCLLAACIRTEHFTQARLDLLVQFASVFALALSPGDFHEHSQVHLRYIPRPSYQEEYLKTFRQRVNQLMAQAGREGHLLSNARAEQQAWQDIEEELIKKGQELDEESLM
jgi:hypothetical protein